MCQSAHAMYEGKNIHYSAVDNKPLCSFSAKLCNQRRLNGYAFCVRHILEDATAPFKRCAYVAKSSNQMCTQPIPRHEERRYCNNHMQVLGMLPRKERKPKKEKETNASQDNRLSFEDRVKSKFNMAKIKNEVSKKEPSVEDPDDPYAFPDPVKDTPLTNNVSPQPVPNVDVPKPVQPSPGRSKSPGDGGSSIAKLYPELAEKLEKIRPKVEPRVKGRIRSSRTMNKLQTKIAQNKIKDKLRKSQESGSNQSDVSPASMPSPDASPGMNQQLPFVGTFPPIDGASHPPGLSVVPSHPLGSTVAQSHPPGRTTVSSHPPGPSEVPANFVGFQHFNHSPLSSRLMSPHVLPPPYPGPAYRPPVPQVPHTPSKQVPTPSTVPQPTSPVAPAVIPPAPQLPPPPPYVAPQPPPVAPSPKIPVLLTRPQQMKHVFMAKDARTRLKKESAVKYYSFYAKRKRYNHNFLGSGLCSSDEDESQDEDVDMVPWQPDWFSASSDEENNEDDQDDDLPLHVRTTKLALLRARLRRQCNQTRNATRNNTAVRSLTNQATLALIEAVRVDPPAAVRTLWEILRWPAKTVDRYKRRGLERRPCLHKNDDEVQCTHRALPYTNHCQRHIMYNVDQQLFDYCTAKFSDNTQCCVPVFDIRHELPLCIEHGVKADNYQKIQDVDVKKRPRKKTKPAALTRPYKKGKKKKKARYIRPQKPIPPSEPSGDIAMPDAENPEEPAASPEPEEKSTVEEPDNEESMDIETPTSTPSVVKEEKGLDQALASVELEEMLPPGRIEDHIDKTFGEMPLEQELPLEQASRLLEEQDFQDVFNRIPDEAFDIFSGKNGEYEPTREETEELERALAAATKDVCAAKDTLEKLVKGNVSVDELSEELTRTIAETLLAQSMQNSAIEGNLAGNSVPSESMHDGMSTLSRNLPFGGGNTNLTPVVPVTVSNQIFNRLQSMTFNPGHSGVIPFSGGSNSGNSVVGTHTPIQTNLPTVNAGYSVGTSAQPNSNTLPNRTAPQRGFSTSQGVALAGYHGNLPYSALSQQLAMSQQSSGQPLPRQTLPNAVSSGQLRVDSTPILTHANLPQQPIHSQTIIPSPLAGPRTVWPPHTSSGPSSVNYQNGFPVSQTPFVQTVNIGNQVGKFPLSAQTNLTEFPSKQDPHYASMTHSMGVSPIRAPVQGFVTTFSSVMPPYTSSSNGS